MYNTMISSRLLSGIIYLNGRENIKLETRKTLTSNDSCYIYSNENCWENIAL